MSASEPTKLKSFTSRFLYADSSLYRVDDVFDLAGDDDPVAAAPTATTEANGGVTTAPGSPDQLLGSPPRGGDAHVNLQPAPGADDGNECVVCLCNNRNALILPCRHLCLCTECAPMVRQQSNKCPVCRTAIQKVVAVG